MREKRYTIRFPEGTEFEYDEDGDYRLVGGGAYLDGYGLQNAGAIIEEVKPKPSELPFGTVILASKSGRPWTLTREGWVWFNGLGQISEPIRHDYFDDNVVGVEVLWEWAQ